MCMNAVINHEEAKLELNRPCKNFVILSVERADNENSVNEKYSEILLNINDIENLISLFKNYKKQLKKEAKYDY